MSLELIVIGILVTLMIAQNVFWARINLSLINRLMSRDYQEFAHGKKTEKQKISAHPVLAPLDDVVVDPESERQAQDLNSLFNMA